MLAGGAGWDCQEFFEGEDAGFTAFPACLKCPLALAVSLSSDRLKVSIFGVQETKTDSKVLSLTLLSLVEHRWPRMVNTVLIRVGEFFAAPFVDTLGRHFAT